MDRSNQQSPELVIDNLISRERDFSSATVQFVYEHLRIILVWGVLAIALVAALTIRFGVADVAKVVGGYMDLLAMGTIAVAGFVSILLATITAGPELLRAWWKRDAGPPIIGWISVWFGRALLLSLDLLIGADIVESIATASDDVRGQWDELGRLAAIVAVRVVLGYFLRGQTDSVARSELTSRRHMQKPVALEQRSVQTSTSASQAVAR